MYCQAYSTILSAIYQMPRILSMYRGKFVLMDKHLIIPSGSPQNTPIYCFFSFYYEMKILVLSTAGLNLKSRKSEHSSDISQAHDSTSFFARHLKTAHIQLSITMSLLNMRKLKLQFDNHIFYLSHLQMSNIFK